MYLMTVKFLKSQCMLLLWFMLRNNSKTKTQNFLSLCGSSNNTEQTGTSHQPLWDSWVQCFFITHPKYKHAPGTNAVLYQSSHCQYFQFQLKCGTGYFHYISYEDKADVKALEQQQLASSVSASSLRAESKDTAQQPGSVRTKTPWIRCVLQEACSWYLHQFKFCLSACKFYGA